MDELFADIRAAVEGRMWTLALMGTLAIPDICGAIANSDGRATGSRYKDWVNTNLASRYPRLDADEIYQMRCSMLHQGLTATRSYSRTLFVTGTAAFMHNNIIDAAYQLDLRTFADDVIAAAEAWLDSNATDSTVQANLQHTVRTYPDGLAPFIVGTEIVT